jgi:hypothetical protein
MWPVRISATATAARVADDWFRIGIRFSVKSPIPSGAGANKSLKILPLPLGEAERDQRRYISVPASLLSG